MMRYGDYLRSLLQPLGVYSFAEGSVSGAALDALGAALDEAAAKLSENQRESLILTAKADGLSKMEALFPFFATGQNAAARRAALGGFLRISGDGFTREAINGCLAACGSDCAVYETAERGVVEVRFAKTVGEPVQYAEKRRVIESILPAHLKVNFRLLWCTFAMTEERARTWADLAAGTFLQWASDVPLPIAASWE